MLRLRDLAAFASIAAFGGLIASAASLIGG